MGKKIIALDIDQYRIGICGLNYEEIFSSVYSYVKKNTWKPSLFKKQSNETNGSEILLQGMQKSIYWGITKRYSRRLEAYQTFGNVLEQLENNETVLLVRSALAYLADKKPELFDRTEANQLRCSLCIGVPAKSSDELSAIEKYFQGEFWAEVNGEQLTILVENVTLVPKTFGAILENACEDYLNCQEHEIAALSGLNYVLDLSDHYVTCDVYDNGELIKSERISDGLYKFSDRIVQEYKTSCMQQNQTPFQIDKDMVYNVLAEGKENNLLTVNGRQQIDLSELIKAEAIEETKKVLSCLIKDNDLQYADNIIIRDLEKGIINQKSVDRYLENFGLYCTKLNNKSARGSYAFATLFSGDDFLEASESPQVESAPIHSQEEAPEAVEAVEDLVDTSSTVLDSSIQDEMNLQTEAVEESVEASEPLQAAEPVETIEEEPDTHADVVEKATAEEAAEPVVSLEEAEVEIEDILKEQADLLNSLAEFDDDFL
ncbi:hypothetical protein [Enterococcus pallens]|uniref:Actin-like protein N-terminal domain-containing protein n=1 Tax=Enterococcus pallens ATCC BAA-351 TaxID=1158607 RepID=R2SGD3_9ENTE|nr:hypothetical protein [Enterococcus pallens]EOH91921.1 hypothetical protein UAU_03223 [Enterococcus pallens ATCC BAA-351]EOU25348.1 hypothetical protein I588_01336 [Enterococcus pallens ATCC BAA-351]